MAMSLATIRKRYYAKRKKLKALKAKGKGKGKAERAKMDGKIAKTTRRKRVKRSRPEASPLPAPEIVSLDRY